MKTNKKPSINDKLVKKLVEVQDELAELKRQNVQLKMLKDAEKKYQHSYISNCIKVMHIVKEK
jgi:hypothetical protein